jgi:hypothetical protein
MCNLSAVDRSIRIVFGLALLTLVFVGPQTLWGLTGLALLATGMSGYCPIYALLGYSSRAASSRKAAR